MGMLKEDWQKIAKDHGVKYTDDNTVRYLVEKVAEIIGVDDKIVNTNTLKKKVLEKLDSLKKEKKKEKTEPKAKEKPSETKKETKKTTKPKKETKKSETKKSEKKKVEKKESKPELTEEQIKAHYESEAKRLNVNYSPQQTWQDIEKLIEFSCKQNKTTYTKHDKTEVSQNTESPEEKENKEGGESKLEELRKKCKDVGLAYTEKHDEKDLTQLLQALQGSAGVPTTPPQGQGVNTPNQPPVADEQPAMIGQNLPNVIQEPEPVKEIVQADEKDLKHYADVFLHTINGHFRAMTVVEIQELFARSKYPFSHSIKRNKDNNSQIEIHLHSGKHKRRIPFNEKEWIDVRG